MKIVITGITSFRNHGVEALVTTTLDQFRQRLPGASFLVLDRMPEFDSSRVHEPDVKFKLDESIRPLYGSKLRRSLIGLSGWVEVLGREYQATLRDLQTAGAVVASGGDVFGSEYGHHSLLQHLQPLKVARKAGVPFFLHAQSIGPFKNDPDTAAFVGVARDAAHITVRERMSYDYVTGPLGLSRDRVTFTADPAFLLRPIEAPWRRHFGFGNDRPLVALSVSQAICHWMNSNYDRHLAVWTGLIERLLREWDANLILIPHVQETTTKNDDRILATALQRHFQFDPRLQLAGGDFTASDFKGIISQCDLVVAERMHAAIAGLSSSIATVVVGYSVKGEGILTDLLDAATVRETTLVPIAEFLEGENAWTRVQRAWEGRVPIQATLKERLPEVRRRSGLSFDVVADFLKRTAR